ALGTSDFVPSSTKSSPSRRARDSRCLGSNSGRGSSTASAAAGAFSPTNSGRYRPCWSASPHRLSAVPTAPGASAANASPTSPSARASATSTAPRDQRSSNAPPSASGTPIIVMPSSELSANRASGAAHAASASSAAGSSRSAANERNDSSSI